MTNILDLAQGSRDDYRAMYTSEAQNMYSLIKDRELDRVIRTPEAIQREMNSSGFSAGVIAIDRLVMVRSPIRLTLASFLYPLLWSGSAGKAILAAWTLHRIYLRGGSRGGLTLDTVVRHLPLFPTDEFIQRVWNSQKGGEQFGGNLLDLRETWEAPRGKED